MTNKATGAMFRKARQKKKLTQVQVAEAVGIHINTYARAERGEQRPDFAIIKKIATVLDIDLNDLPA